MIKVKHHSGQERIVNPHNIEMISPDASGQAVVRMVSGVEFTLPQTYDAVCGAVKDWIGKDIVAVEGPGPEHPEIAQKGPLAAPTGEQSPAVPERGVPYGAPGYDEAKEQRKADEHARAMQEHERREHERREHERRESEKHKKSDK